MIVLVCSLVVSPVKKGRPVRHITKLVVRTCRPIVIATLIVLLGFTGSVRAATYYVVIGSFSQEQGAARLAASLSDILPDVSVTFDAARSLYYVHVLETNAYPEAERLRNTLSSGMGFSSAWIYADFSNAGTRDTVQSPGNGVSLELYTGNKVLISSTDNTILSVSKHARAKGAADWGAETPFVFVAKNRSGLAMSGEVSLMRGGRAVSSFATGEFASFGGQHGRLTFLCEVPGYNPSVREIDMSQLGATAGVHVNRDGVWQVSFPLTRMKPDEMSLVYHRIFFDNAAIVQSSGKVMLEALAALMEADPRLHISLDSHCNPRATRELRVAEKDGSIFDLEASRLESGSDKQLTKLRAECIRDYLVGEGIDRERIAVMGWGHLNMIVKEAEADSSVNDRVEVRLIMK